jgi:glycosyltransferase involved in cell wall biosynthesis
MYRILLVGEYSGVHTDLADALKKRGHYVVTAHSGDSFKNYPRDFDLNITGKSKLSRLYEGAIKHYRFYRMIKKEKFDIIQFINPALFPPYLDNMLFAQIFKIKSKFVLLACGGDTLVWQAYKKGLYKYYPYDGLSAADLENTRSFYESERLNKLSDKIYNRVDKIIPLLVEYLMAYESQSAKIHFIPLSIDCNRIGKEKFKDVSVGNKIKIYHPVSKGRETEKGSDIILKVLEKIGAEYQDRVEIITSQSISFEAYKKNLAGMDIVIDQIYSYSPSMNALYSMSLGKVVLGGAETEYLNQLNISSAPIINIIADFDDMYNKLVTIIKDPEQIKKIGKESLDFVRQYHSVEKTVVQFEKVWGELLQ